MRTLPGLISRARPQVRGRATALAAAVLAGALLLSASGGPVPSPSAAAGGAVRPSAAVGGAAAMTGAAPGSAPVSLTDRTWQVVWRDDFTGRPGAAPSTANWIVDRGHRYPGGPDRWGTGEIEEYTANQANLGQDGRGNLRITATRDARGTWRSARVETVRADFQPLPGGRLRIEARIQLPGGGRGYWPAFWALGAPFRTNRSAWPASGEVDVMENINNRASVHGTVHCGFVEVGGPCREDTGLTASYPLGVPAGSAGFHVYTVVWSTAPARLDWYVDGRQYWSVTPAMTGAPAWRAAFGHGFFLLLNLAIGGGWPGPPAAGTRPGQSMLVDYVAVYRGAGSAVLQARPARAPL